MVDGALETPVFTSFSSIGYHIRRRSDDWRPLWDYDLRGRTVAITGPTSGLGAAAVQWFARLGATLVLIARDEEKITKLVEQLRRDFGTDAVTPVLADLGEPVAVRDAARHITAAHAHIDVLIHNAGSLLPERRTQSDGIETTVAVQVVGPFLLTGLLLGHLPTGSRVITMSSGGMYTVPLTVDGIEMDATTYRGPVQYALAKRAQVTLNAMWAERLPDLRFHALHPGWADTPGVAASLPGFHRLAGPFLRTPDQGADTLVWLTADDGLPAATTGEFWLDRRMRALHKTARTRRSDTPARRERLWDWAAARAGWDLR